MKLLLLQPPVRDFYDTEIRLQPVGLCYLKAAVKKFFPEMKVVVKDYHQGWGRKTVPLPKELAYLKDYYATPDRSPFSTFYHFYHFGASFTELAEDVTREKPDIVGIASLFSPYFREVLRAAAEIKKRIDVPILAGGAHVSAAPLQMLGAPGIDFVIRGEGERPLVEFLRAWTRSRDFTKVPNLGYKQNGRLILNHLEENYPIEELPSADFSDLDPGRYLFEKKPLSFVVASRGCPYACAFCSVHQTFGKHFRRHPNCRLLQEIKQRYHEGIRVFDFEDDNLTWDREAMKSLCEELINAFPGKDVRFSAMNGISYLSLDQELLGWMKRAGFTHLNIALVTTDEAVQKKMGRPHDLQRYRAVVRAAAEWGFKVVSYQILGLPDESLDSMIRTLAFSAGLPVLLGASPFYLTPGAPMTRDFPELTEEDILKSRLTAMAVETKNFDRMDLYTLFITTRILNFLKGICFEGERISLKSALAIVKMQGGRAEIGGLLLKKLFEEGVLYAATRHGLKRLPRFKTALFLRLWNEIPEIVTQEGKTITGLQSFVRTGSGACPDFP